MPTSFGSASHTGGRRRRPQPLSPGLSALLEHLAPGGGIRHVGPITSAFEPTPPNNPFTPHIRKTAAARAAWIGAMPEVQAPAIRPIPSLQITTPQTVPEAIRFAEAGNFGSIDPSVKGNFNDPARGEAAYRQLLDAAVKNVSAKEGIHADPLAELGINLIATAGVGGLASLAAKGGESAGAAGAAALADEAASEAAPKTVPQLVAEAARSVRGAPQAAREGIESLGSAAGRRAAARAAGEAGANQVLEHPKLAQQGFLGVTGAATGAHTGGLQIPRALLEGQWNALTHNFGGTLQTTGRGLVGAVTAPAALLYSAGESAVTGSPNPFLNTAGGLGESLEHMGGEILSGDPARVQKATEDEAGLFELPLLPRALSGRLADAARNSARDSTQAARDFGTRHTPFEFAHGPDESYAIPRLQRRAERIDVAKMGQRETLPERNRAHFHRKQLERDARHLPNARSLRNVHGREGGDVASTLAEFGINDPGQLGLLDRLPQSREGRLEHDVTLGSVLDQLRANPELITHPAMRRFLEDYRRNTEALPIQKAGSSRRATYLPQAGLFGIRPPEFRVPHAAREFTDAADRAGAWRDLKAMEDQVKSIRHEARREAVRSNEANRLGDSEEAGIARTGSEGMYRQARELEGEAKSFRKALSPYSRPGSAISIRARRKLWDDKLVNEFVDETRAAASAHGLDEPIYTHHGEFRTRGQRIGSKRGGGIPNRAQHIRRPLDDPQSLFAQDAVDRSLSSLIEGGVEGPRAKAGGQRFIRRFFAAKHIPLTIKGVKKSRVTEREYDQAIRDGQIDSRNYVWVPESEYKQSYLDRSISSDEAANAKIGDLRKGVNQGVASKDRLKGLVVRKESYKEFEAQVNPKRWIGENFVNFASKGAGRVLLFSPAWIQLQAIAEAIPIFMDNPRLLNPAKVVQLDRRLRKLGKVDKEAALGFAGAMGEAPVRISTARELQPNFSPTHSMFDNAARAIEHNPIGRALFSTVRLRPFVLFDQWRQGKYREILAAAEVDRQFNGFLSGLQGAVRGQRELSRQLRAIDDPVEQLRAINSEHFRPELDRIGDHVDDILGNWTAFTRFERAFAPFAIFYGFMRYAMRWPLTFSRRHPMVATIDYALSQANSEQLEKLLGAPPASFREFANPVVQNGEGERQELSAGVRIAPGLSPVAQGGLEGNAPAAAVGATNPLYGALLGLVTGVDSFGGHDEDPGLLGLHWSLATKQLVSTPPVLRLLGVGQSESDTAKELRANDPNRAIRSFGLPFLPLGEDAAKANNDLIRSIDEYEKRKADNGGYPPSESSSSGNPFLEGAGSSSTTSDNPFLR